MVLKLLAAVCHLLVPVERAACEPAGRERATLHLLSSGHACARVSGLHALVREAAAVEVSATQMLAVSQ